MSGENLIVGLNTGFLAAALFGVFIAILYYMDTRSRLKKLK
ncbi:MAG: hypothetical protein Q8Q30_01150 [Candidatus Woesebacteria bacterium]|nr:hypothetical protein [Candidatus Woesebacteria bacterium]